MKRKIIVGNWKMNPTTLSEAVNLFKKVKNTAQRLAHTHVIVCPPFPYITKFTSSTAKPSVGIGAQNAFFEERGAFTGEVSPVMLRDLGVSHVIIGHSERRAEGESDEIVAKKVQAVLESGIHPIVCVGEKDRDAHGLYLDILRIQIKNSLAMIPKRLANQLVIAYEPVWAIGSKEPMEPAVIEETVIFIRKILADIFGQENALRTVILYGGSINFRNAPDIIIRGKVDGLLVGGESVNIPGFTELLKAVDVV
ncbi:MAG: triose-phosphate isomerase [bacterium]|nr:triose-phosphate isomerase [bacterium]